MADKPTRLLALPYFVSICTPCFDADVTGGGAKDPIWTQLKIGVLNKPIKTVAVTEAGCLAVAMLACASDTQEDIRSFAAKWVKVTGEITPNPGNAAYHDSHFLDDVKLYPAMKALAQAQELVEC